jgi:hypothetical protein
MLRVACSCATSISDKVFGKCQFRLFELVPGADCINRDEICGISRAVLLSNHCEMMS